MFRKLLASYSKRLRQDHVTARRGRLTFWLAFVFLLINPSETFLFEELPFVKVVEKPFAVYRTSELMITVFTKDRIWTLC